MSRDICVTVDLEREFIEDDSVFHKKAEQILALFTKYGIKATFFVCADSVAEEKALIRRIAVEHEIAAHGFHHGNLRRLSGHELADEIRRAREAFANADIACVGFRCPYLIVPRRLGFVLKENGFLYDSSLLRSPFSLHSLFYPFSRTAIEGIREIPIQVVTPLKIPF
ncbi:MAG: polysaccharide deacetylase family protein, partial [Candidatus Aminicenantes bacterium]|nr:polysaccharide deacetylase family protein [Candidatus Aminicenantes bacterium]